MHENLDTLIGHVNERLSLLYDFCKFNKLSLNTAKSNYMLITNRPVTSDPFLYIGNEALEKKSAVKYLGVNIDCRLQFGEHLAYLKSRLSQFCGIARRLQGFMNLGAAKRYYYACIYSIIVYCISLWGGELLRVHLSVAY